MFIGGGLRKGVGGGGGGVGGIFGGGPGEDFRGERFALLRVGGLAVAEGLDGIHAAGFEGGVEAADHADADGESDADEDGGGFDDGGIFAFGDFGEESKEAEGSAEAEDPAAEADDATFDNDLEEDIAAFGTDGEADADFADAFGDGSEHDIGDADAADDQADAGDEAAANFGAFDTALHVIEPLFAGDEREVLDAAVGEIEEGAGFFHGFLEAGGVTNLEDELIEFVVGAEVDFVDDIGGFEVIEDGGDGGLDAGIFEEERVPIFGAAGGGSGWGEAIGAAGFFGGAFVLFEDADDGEGSTIDEERLAEGIGGRFAWPEVFGDGLADEADVAGFIEVDLGEDATGEEFVFIDVKVIGPAAVNRGAEGLGAAGEGGVGDRGDWGDIIYQRGAGLDDFGIGEGGAWGDIGEIDLGFWGVLFGDLDFFDAPDLGHEVAHSVGDAGGESESGEEASDAEDDPEHGEDAPEFVGDDFFEAHEEREPEFHGGGRGERSAMIWPSWISIWRGVLAAMEGSWVTRMIVRPWALSSAKRARMESPVWESRFPVGSSAKMIFG